MLEHIHIKNVALIEETELSFGRGLNILSGETGAGKSMVIDSVNFALGERVNKDFIRKGTEQAVVEALFKVEGRDLNEILIDMGLNIEEDNSILISRTLNVKGKAINRVNGSTVTASMLKQLSDALIDVHGQHEHQSLLNSVKHIILLDKFCGEELDEKKRICSVLYRSYRVILNSIQSLSGDERERAHKMDLLQFQIDEIGSANLNDGEEETLSERKKMISNIEKVKRLSTQSLVLLYDGNEEEISAVDKISKSLSFLEDLKNIDSEIEPIYEVVESVYAQLDDVSRQLSKYFRNIDTEPEDINDIEERLNIIYNLKRKYGNNIKEILSYYDKITKEIEFISGSEEAIQKLVEQKDRAETEIAFICEQMTAIRNKKATEIQNKIENQLHDLEMKNAKFEIKMEQKTEFTANGWDKIEFMISANLGEELKPLARIASGGEMSRVMLALKTVLANVDTIETFIFDEIDTGVSGRTAQKVAEKMSLIGNTHQIICITHLPQIAAMSDNHFLIEKSADENKTTTNVYSLSNEKSVMEIARLMGGAKITEVTVKAAEEMKELASEYKRSMAHNEI